MFVLVSDCRSWSSKHNWELQVVLHGMLVYKAIVFAVRCWNFFYGFNDDLLYYRELLLVTSRSLFAEFQTLLLMVYFCCNCNICVQLSCVVSIINSILLWLLLCVPWMQHKLYLLHWLTVFKSFLYISCYFIAFNFPALFFMQKWHMQMFLQLHMSFLMDSKLDFNHEYLFFVI